MSIHTQTHTLTSVWYCVILFIVFHEPVHQDVNVMHWMLTSHTFGWSWLIRNIVSYDCPPIDNHIGLKSTAAFYAAVKCEHKMLHNSSKPLLGLVPCTEGTKYHTVQEWDNHLLCFISENKFLDLWMVIVTCINSLEIKITK